MSINVRKGKLGNIDITDEVVLDVYGNDSGSTSITIKDELTDNSSDPVASRGIWRKLDSLSVEILRQAYASDIKSTDNIEKNNNNAATSNGVWSFCDELSNNITSYANTLVTPSMESEVKENSLSAVKSFAIYNALCVLSNEVLQNAYIHDLSADDKVTENGTNVVKSKGIYYFLSQLSGKIKDAAIAEYISVEMIDNVDPDRTDAGVWSNGIYNALESLRSDLEDKIAEIDISLAESVTKDGISAVTSKAIWEFADKLSNDIKDEFDRINIDLANSVTKDGISAVTSKAIWEFADKLSNDIKDEIDSGGSIEVEFDKNLSETSPNAVENRVITKAINSKLDVVLSIATTSLDNHVWASKPEYNGISLSSIVNSNNQEYKLKYPTLTADETIATQNQMEKFVDVETDQEIAGKKHFSDTIIGNNISVLNNFSGGKDSIANGENSFSFGMSALADNDYSFAEGYQVSALGQRSHAEGSKTLAEGSKTHAEGGGTEAILDMAHAEGEMTHALGRASHTEGKSTYAYMYSHAEGSETSAGYDIEIANAKIQGDIAAHSEGFHTTAIARGSHAEGLSTVAGITNLDERKLIDVVKNGITQQEKDFEIDKGAHAEGIQTAAVGLAAHAEGISSIALGYNTHAEGYSSIAGFTYNLNDELHAESAWGNQGSHAEGYQTSSVARFSHSEGYKTFAGFPSNLERAIRTDRQNNQELNVVGHPDYFVDMAVHAEGYQTSSYFKGAHAEGLSSRATANMAHAEGYQTIAGADPVLITLDRFDPANYGTAHAEGYQTSALAKGAHTEGGWTKALGNYSHACGLYATCLSAYQFVWNGDKSLSKTRYEPNKGTGTFCINPVGGINGIYIGNTALTTYLAGGLDADRFVDVENDQEIAGEKHFYNTISSNADIIGHNISALNDLYVENHLLVGELTSVQFNTGGHRNMAIGNSHKFYGKESFAVHDGNKVGARGFYWKAIDTENKKIYLTDTQPVFDSANTTLPAAGYSTDEDHKYDIPYFGPKSKSAHQELFTPEGNRIKLNNTIVGSTITIWNGNFVTYNRCFKVVSLESNGSVINYTDGDTVLTDSQKRTYFRKAGSQYSSGIKYTDNEYTLYFPDADQSKITCNENAHVPPTSFGCTALGDGNTVMGYDSFAAGQDNKAESRNSIAMGQESKAEGYCSQSIGIKSTANGNYSFAWNGDNDNEYVFSHAGDFGINPKHGIEGFYISDQNFVNCVLEAIKKLGNNATAKQQIRSALGI